MEERKKGLNWGFIFAILFCIVFWAFFIILAVKIFPASAGIDVGLQYSGNKAKTSTEEIAYGVDGRWKKDDVELKVSCHLKQSTINDEIDNSRQFNEMQINNYFRKFFVFFNSHVTDDTALGIDDTYALGGGGGHKTDMIESQIGIYNTSDENPFIKGMLIFTKPINKMFDIKIDIRGELNIEHSRDYKLSNLTSLNVDINERMDLVIGHEINYSNKNILDAINTTRRLFAGITVGF